MTKQAFDEIELAITTQFGVPQAYDQYLKIWRGNPLQRFVRFVTRAANPHLSRAEYRKDPRTKLDLTQLLVNIESKFCLQPTVPPSAHQPISIRPLSAKEISENSWHIVPDNLNAAVKLYNEMSIESFLSDIGFDDLATTLLAHEPESDVYQSAHSRICTAYADHVRVRRYLSHEFWRFLDALSHIQHIMHFSHTAWRDVPNIKRLYMARTTTILETFTNYHTEWKTRDKRAVNQ